MSDTEHLPPNEPYPYSRSHPELHNTSEAECPNWLVDKIDDHITNYDKEFAAVQLRLGDHEERVLAATKATRELSKHLVCTIT